MTEVVDLLQNFSKEYGVEWREPDLLWGIVLVPVLLVAMGVARSTRVRTRDLFRVARPDVPARPPFGRWRRAFATMLASLGLGIVAIGLGRPVWTHPLPRDRATVIVIMDVSLAMRATDVTPSRLEVARRLMREAIAAAPDRVQIAGIAYGPAAYLVAAPTYDHGAVAAALQAVRTVTGAAPGDALSVALAAIPAGTEGARAPAAIIMIASGDATTGRPVEVAVDALATAEVPVHTIAIGPRGAGPTPTANAVPAPFVPQRLMGISRQTRGRSLVAPTGREWREIYQAIPEAVVIEDRPEEVGHLVGSAGLAIWMTGMAVMVMTARRLV